MKRLVIAPDVARALGVHASSVHNWIKKYDIPYDVPQWSSRRHFNIEEVARYIVEHNGKDARFPEHAVAGAHRVLAGIGETKSAPAPAKPNGGSKPNIKPGPILPITPVQAEMVFRDQFTAKDDRAMDEILRRLMLMYRTQDRKTLRTLCVILDIDYETI